MLHIIEIKVTHVQSQHTALNPCSSVM